MERTVIYALGTVVSLMLKIYTSQFTSFHGFSKITRFIDYHVSDIFSVVLFSFMGIKLLCIFSKKHYKFSGYFVPFLVTLFAFLTEYSHSWKSGELTKIGDKIDLIMYIIGFFLFSIIYYLLEKNYLYLKNTLNKFVAKYE